MAAPNVITKSSGATTQGGTSQTCNLPAGVTTGDFLLLLVHVTVNNTLTGPTGWDELYSWANGSAGRCYAFGRIADGSEGASVTVTVSATGKSTAYHCLRYDGSSDVFTLPDSFSAYSGVVPYSATINPPALTLATVAERSWGACAWKPNWPDSIVGYPTGYTDTAYVSSSGAVAYAASLAVCTKDAEASSEDPGNFTANFGVSFASTTWAVEAMPGREFTPPELVTEVGFQAGVALEVAADAALFPTRIGVEVGLRTEGLSFRPGGSRQVMLTGSDIETPEMTEDGAEGQVLTYHEDGPPTWEDAVGALALDDLSDVAVPTPTDGDVLTWSEYDLLWIASPPAGGGTLDDLTDVDVPAPGDGEVLAWDSGTSAWVAVAPGTPTIDWGETADIVTQAFGDSADAGVLDEVARADHTHGMPAAPTTDWGETGDIVTLAFGDAPDAGALDEVARADHTHGMPANPGAASPALKWYLSATFQ